MCMIASSLLFAIIGINLANRDPKMRPVPKWLKTVIVQRLGKLLRIQLPDLSVSVCLMRYRCRHKINTYLYILVDKTHVNNWSRKNIH